MCAGQASPRALGPGWQKSAVTLPSRDTHVIQPSKRTPWGVPVQPYAHTQAPHPSTHPSMAAWRALTEGRGWMGPGVTCPRSRQSAHLCGELTLGGPPGDPGPRSTFQLWTQVVFVFAAALPTRWPFPSSRPASRGPERASTERVSELPTVTLRVSG